MADPVSYNPILIAGITASAAIVGGLISSGANYLIERQRGKREAEKVKLDSEAKRLERRDQAYIKFLSITEDDLMFPNDNGSAEFHPERAEQSIAFVITHGSPAIRAKVTASYPFGDWDEFLSVKQYVMAELLTERGGFDLYKKHIRPLVEGPK